ncbi:rhomboid family intramembrane serine protease [Lysobacter sp. A289]
MLILPLHRPLTRATFPFVTVVLIAINVLVFLGWQVGDNATMLRAQQHYLDADLGRYEVPAYERHLLGTSQADALAEFERVSTSARPAYVARITLTDVVFVAMLQSGEGFDQVADFQAWQPLRVEYDALLGDVFTLRHLLRSSEVDPWRMLSSAFLHGGLMHLVGNMLFLLALGLLVEGAIGSGRFMGVYLLGALASSAVSLLWRWGEASGGLGASGAVAALMGAFCVVWGRQPVRFFYWFGVVFDYVRAPAIWLLPLWLGWEVYNLLVNEDLGVGFDAHAGGIISGALMGMVLVGLGQVRNGFIGKDDAAALPDDRWERAQADLGRMRLLQAETLLLDLTREQPERFEVRLALYRVACNGKQAEAVAQRATGLLQLPVVDADEVAAQRTVLLELDDAGIVLDPGLRTTLVRRWLEVGELDAAEAGLASIGSAADAPEQARLWFQLALARRDEHQAEAHARALRMLVKRYPQQPQATKAQFLLAGQAAGHGDGTSTA